MKDGKPDNSISKHSFTHEMGIDFTGSGTTDGGLSFGAKAGFDTGKDKTNEGTVWISGTFGTITFGDNDAADKLSGGIADVGLFDVGVDDVAEGIFGTTPNQFRYDNSFGSIRLAVSAGTQEAVEGKANTFNLDGGIWVAADVFRNAREDRIRRDGAFEVRKNGYAVGMSFTASDATIGLGYDSNKAISIGLGYSAGPISANVFYAKRDRDYRHFGSDHTEDVNVSAALQNAPGSDGGPAGEIFDGTATAKYAGLGVDLSYTMGASKLTLAYAKTDIGGIQPAFDLGGGDNENSAAPGGTGANADSVSFGSASFKGIGIGFEHDLGGGAKLVAGFARVPQKQPGDLTAGDFAPVHDRPNNAETGDDDHRPTAADRPILNASRNVASIGLTFAF